MQVYWASVLIIPKGIILDIQQLIRGFLWCNGELKRGKAKVAWDVICLPKKEDGLGFSIKNCVADLVVDNNWIWPQAWLLKAPNLGLIVAHVLVDDRPDVHQWKASNGKLSAFYVSCVWEELRPRAMEVSWYQIPWFSYCIPRHAFHIWLVMRRSLKMQYMLRQWDVSMDIELNLLKCVFCDSQPDSHEHLFFECLYSARVWHEICMLAGMDLVAPNLKDIISFLQPMAHRRTAKSIIGRLLLAASSYFIWLERNNRLFKKVRKLVDEMRDTIMVTVRLKLLTFRFKNTAMVHHLLSQWKMPMNFRLYGC
ncbi:retrotransposon protein, putative, ty1-copia subclass [Tanacetum coccineum]